MNSFDELLLSGLSLKNGEKIPASTLVELRNKGVELEGTIAVRLKEEGEPLDNIPEKAFQAAVLRVEDIIDGVISRNMLSDTFFTTTTVTRKKSQVAVPAKATGLRDSGGRYLSAINLARLLNITIFEHVKDNMVRPALKYGTGRFAHSVQINELKVLKSPSENSKGKASIYFSYMLLPYAVFSGDENRDPGELIRKAVAVALRKALNTASFSKMEFDVRQVKGAE
jgi:hypothetical protein